MKIAKYYVESFPLILLVIYFTLMSATRAIPTQSPYSFFSNLDFWGSAAEKETGESEIVDDSTDVPLQINSAKCPSRKGEELLDYWRCLWGTSITVEGMEEERGDIIELYAASAAAKPLNYNSRIRKKRELEGGNLDDPFSNTHDKRMKRRRLVPRYDLFADYPELKVFLENKLDVKPPEIRAFANDSRNSSSRQKRDVSSEDLTKIIQEGNTDFAWMLAWNHDLLANLDNFITVRNCQYQFVRPGVSVKGYIDCLKGPEDPQQYTQNELFGAYREQKEAAAAQVNITYDKREYTIPSLMIPKNKTSSDLVRLDLEFSFNRLINEDHQPGFEGADPYLSDHLGQYRYRYNNLEFQQRQPAWSYTGKDGARSWHNLELKQFFLPLSSKANLDKVFLFPEFVEAYAGTAPIIEYLGLAKLFEDLWDTDKGYYAYTRYLIPNLLETDIEYLKYKNAIPDTFTRRDDSSNLDFAAQKLKDFLNLTKEPLTSNPEIVTPADVPFVNAYRTFIHTYYGVDLRQINEGFAKYSNATNSTVSAAGEYEVIRRVIRYYLLVVATYMECLTELTRESEDRLERKELFDVLGAVVVNPVACPSGSKFYNPNFKDIYNIHTLDPELGYVGDELNEIYDNYFNRKDARVAYSLPLFPYKFPICRQNEPSPINILTSKGRKSALRDYVLGEAGYRIESFFMMYPNDGSPLLTVGLLNGERLDYSSVQLRGGAVKGENLTFQYMFFRFSHSWDVVGSEHKIDGVGAQMEIQMLFTISGSADELKYYHILTRVQNQLFQSRGNLVIVLSRLVEVLPDDDALKMEINKRGTGQDPYLFEPFSQAAYHFRKQWQNTPTKKVPRGYVSRQPTFRLIDFFPKTKSEYYTYRGSLTWPPCFSYVLWSVFEQRLYMSKRQFDEFAKIPAFGIANNNLASDNFRDAEDIYVEAENLPNVDYSLRQHLIKERTVERFILIGIHEPDLQSTGGLVDGENYYSLDSNDYSSKVSKIGSGWLLLQTVIAFACLLWNRWNFNSNYCVFL